MTAPRHHRDTHIDQALMAAGIVEARGDKVLHTEMAMLPRIIGSPGSH
jgi:hypothetical protein